MKRTLSLLIIGAVAAQAAHALVEPGHWSVSNEVSRQDPEELQALLGIDQTAGGDWTGAVLSVSGHTLQGYTLTLDGGAGFYVVEQGRLLTQDLLASGAVPALGGVTEGGPWKPITVGQDFWVGARIRETGDGTGPWTGLGWAHLGFNVEGGLVILDSAVAFHETSLLVGAVPEPASWASMGAGLALIGLVAARRRA